MTPFVYLLREKESGKFYCKDGNLWDGKNKVTTPRVFTHKGHANSAKAVRVYQRPRYQNAEVVRYDLTNGTVVE